MKDKQKLKKSHLVKYPKSHSEQLFKIENLAKEIYLDNYYSKEFKKQYFESI